MRTQEFNEIVDVAVLAIKEVLANKASEYSTEDRLHNFKVAARVNNTTPEKALWGMASKHLVSIMDLVEGNHKIKKPILREKIQDMINYLILLEALLIEKGENEYMELRAESAKNGNLANAILELSCKESELRKIVNNKKVV